MKKLILVLSCAACVLTACRKDKTDPVIPVSSVVLSPVSLSLTEGESSALQVSVLPADAADYTVAWTSSAPDIASVSEHGVVSALSEGTAAITVSAGGKNATCQVTVIRRVIPVSSVSVNPASLSMTEGETSVLSATVLPADASDPSVSWSSSDEAVATVSSTGEVTAIRAGVATVTVTSADGEKSAICDVTVEKSMKILWYTSSDGKTVSPHDASAVGELISNTYVGGMGKMVFEADITSIGAEAFSGCAALSGITLPETVTSIGEKAFEGCSALEKVYVPEHVTAVGVGAFHNCPRLGRFEGPLNEWEYHGLIIDNTLVAFAPADVISFVLPGTVTAIADRVFEDCGALLGVSLPYATATIGNYVFAGCTALESVTAPRHEPPTLGTGAFDHVETDYIIYVESGREQVYREAPGWHPYESHIQVMEYDVRSGR